MPGHRNPRRWVLALLPLWWPPSTARRALATLRGRLLFTAGQRNLPRSPLAVRRPPLRVREGRATAKSSRAATTTQSITTVLASHSADLWGLFLATLGVLGAIAIFGDSLGPIGRGVRVAAGDLFGTGRFALPLALLAAGVLLVAAARQRESLQEPDWVWHSLCGPYPASRQPPADRQG